MNVVGRLAAPGNIAHYGWLCSVAWFPARRPTRRSKLAPPSA